MVAVGSPARVDAEAMVDAEPMMHSSMGGSSSHQHAPNMQPEVPLPQPVLPQTQFQSSALQYFVKYCSKPDHSQARGFTASTSVEQPEVDHYQHQQHAAYDRLCALADQLPENPGVLHSDPWQTPAQSSDRSV